MSKFVCTPCAPLSQIECRAISDEHLLGQGFDVVRPLISLARFPVIPPEPSYCRRRRRLPFKSMDLRPAVRVRYSLG